MNILHVVTLLSDDGSFGGPLRVALNQGIELQRRGHCIKLASTWRGSAVPPDELQGVTVRLFSARQIIPKAGFSGIGSWGLATWLRKNIRSFDVVHIHAGRDLVTLCALGIAAAANVPVVIQTHGMVGVDPRLRARVLDALFVRRLFNRARKQLALTAREERDLETILRTRDGIARLGNGVDTSAITGNAGKIRSSEVLYVARLHARKRPMAFVEMASVVSRRHPQARFSIIGPDEGQLDRLSERISELNVGGSIQYEGPLPYDKVLARLEESAIYVLPSYEEPFPMSLLEALAAGLACVCTDQCGFSQQLVSVDAAIVTDGSIESLVEAVDELLCHPERRRALGAAGQQVVEELFSIRKVVDDLSRIYSDVLCDADAEAPPV